MPEQSLAGVPAKWHRAMLNEKCKGESLSYPFTEHYPECILDARYTESLNSSKFLCACLSYPTLSECCVHLSSASLCLGLPNKGWEIHNLWVRLLRLNLYDTTEKEEFSLVPNRMPVSTLALSFHQYFPQFLFLYQKQQLLLGFY